MKIIVGLGNPGSQYAGTRHNVGFQAVDRIMSQWGISHSIKRFKGHLFFTSHFSQTVCIVKPMTYMNFSGDCIGPLVSFYQCSSSDLIVIHDDLDLRFGVLRIKHGGGSAGHNGLKSISSHFLKDQSYYRIRIGIGRPSVDLEKHQQPKEYVLAPFAQEEIQALDSILSNVCKMMEYIFAGRITEAMNQFHRSHC